MGLATAEAVEYETEYYDDVNSDETYQRDMAFLKMLDDRMANYRKNGGTPHKQVFDELYKSIAERRNAL